MPCDTQFWHYLREFASCLWMMHIHSLDAFNSLLHQRDELFHLQFSFFFFFIRHMHEKAFQWHCHCRRLENFYELITNVHLHANQIPMHRIIEYSINNKLLSHYCGESISNNKQTRKTMMMAKKRAPFSTFSIVEFGFSFEAVYCF